MAQNIYIFYGFSGSQRSPMPAFPAGKDHDQSLALTAQTLQKSLAASYPGDHVEAVQAWSKDVLLQKLEGAAAGSIRQVHVCCHGDSAMLSLAYRFDGGKRLVARAKKFNAMAGTDNARALKAMAQEDAIIAGFFANALDKKRLAKIRKNHAAGASWQIWGCYAGSAATVFGGFGHADGDPYLKRFNLGKSSIDGVAVDIAKSLGVTVTGAAGKGGLEFWHGESGKSVVRNDTKTQARLPFWLWNVASSTWHTFDSAGAQLSKPTIFQTARDPKALKSGKPPKWLTDLYYTAIAPPAKTKGLATLSDAFALGQPQPHAVQSAWFDDGDDVPALGGVDWHRGLSADATSPAAPRRELPARLDWPAAEGPAPGLATGQAAVISPSTGGLAPDRRVVMADGPSTDDGSLHAAPVRDGTPAKPALQEHAGGGGSPAVAPPPVALDPGDLTDPKRGLMALVEDLANDEDLELPEQMAEQMFSGSEVDEDEENFQQALKEAMAGEGPRAEEERRRQAAEDGHVSPPSSSSHDVFNHLSKDLVHATNYDLGTLAVTRENLGAFAQEILDEPAPNAAMFEHPVVELAADDDGLPNLEDGDVLHALAGLSRQAAAKKPKAAPPMPAKSEPPAPAPDPAPAKPVLGAGQAWPNKEPGGTVGPFFGPVLRGSPAFEALVQNDNPAIRFRTSDKSGSDRMMTPPMKAALDALATSVAAEWPGASLRVLQGWDEDPALAKTPAMQEGRGAELGVAKADAGRLGRLAALATKAGFDWVAHVDGSHVAVAVAAAPAKPAPAQAATPPPAKLPKPADPAHPHPGAP